MKNIIKILFFIICITSISKFAFSKSPPPGTGTADVPANILIMLDNSGSMAWDIEGRERYANNTYVNRPMDVVRDDNGDIYVYGNNTRKITVLGSDGSFKRELMGYGPGKCNMAYYGFKFDIYDNNIYYLEDMWHACQKNANVSHYQLTLHDGVLHNILSLSSCHHGQKNF